MLIQYGDGWIKFPDCVWEPSGFKEENGESIQLWTSRPVTSEDIKSRKALADMAPPTGG